MIHLHTGLPGAGKTLCTLVEVKSRAERENRPVYYSGIADLRLPWTELDKGEDWHTLPAGSIVVIDEAQRVFRPRHTGSNVPEHVAKLETHRHLGIDLYIVTQHPKLVDSNVRRLVGQHVHFVRAFGSNAVTRHQWGEVKDDPQARDDSIKQLVPYPKEAFAWYKSAEVHTHKRRIPWRVWGLLAVPVMIAGLAWFAVHSFGRWFEADRITDAAAPVAADHPKDGARAARPGPSGVPPVNDGTKWLYERRARVPGLVHTAPIYDSITQPVRAPYPAACLSSASRCVCYSQQGTRMALADDLCRRIASDGFFVDWEDRPPDREQSAGSGGQVAPQVDPGIVSASAAIVPGGVESAPLGPPVRRPPVRARGPAIGQPTLPAP